MKTRCLLFLLLLILITLPSLIILVGTSAAAGETDQSQNINNIEDLAPYKPLVQMAEDILTQLHKKPLPNRENAPQAIARGFDVLQDLLNTDKKHVQELGLLIDKGTIKDFIKDVQLRAYPVFEIHLDDLRAFSPGSDVNQLLFYTDQLLLSIGTGKQAQTSLTIRFTHNEQQKPGTITWHPTRWGRPNLIHDLTKAQANRPLGFLVSIPSLNRNFLGYKENTVIKLVPLAEDHLLKAKESYLAEDVFTWLSAEAKSVDNSPR